MKNNISGLKLSTHLTKYIMQEYGLQKQNLIIDDKFTKNHFTTNIPNIVGGNKNIEYLNGYPHFNIPNEVLEKEIELFLNHESIYSNNIVIRYGDTHLEKSTPNMSQIRNLYLSNFLQKSLITSGDISSYFLIGDIGEKTILYILNKLKYDLNFLDYYYRDIINSRLKDEKIKMYINELSLNSSLELNELFSFMGYKMPNILFESSIHKNKNLYQFIKGLSSDYLKSNGEIKYTLQELMYALTFNFNNPIFISLIGANQIDHTLKVKRIIDENNLDLNYNFYAYELCLNGKERDFRKWENDFRDFIQKKYGLNISNIPTFLNILFSSLPSSSKIDFENLSNIKAIMNKINFILKVIGMHENKKLNDTILSKMSMCNIKIDNAILSNKPNILLDYIYDLCVEYSKINTIEKSDKFNFEDFIDGLLDKINIKFSESEKRSLI